MGIDESKIKTVVIASVVSALLVFVLSTLWLHQTEITTLRTNQQHVLGSIAKLDSVPSQLIRINTQLEFLRELQVSNKELLTQNAKMLKGGK